MKPKSVMCCSRVINCPFLRSELVSRDNELSFLPLCAFDLLVSHISDTEHYVHAN